MPIAFSPRARGCVRAVLFAGAAVALAACSTSARQAGEADSAAAADSGMATAPGDSGWRALFDGRSTAGWKGYRTDTVPSAWHAVDGVLTKTEPTGDILTRDKYGDFELAFDWKLDSGGNAGVFYRGTEEYDHIYWSAPEYQLLDDAHHPDGRNRLTSAGAAYALYAPPAGIVKPAGEWNSSRIVAKGAHVEHWLNGQKLLEYELWSPDWEARVQASKFKDWPNYGRATSGYIGIQGDHDGELSLRNIRIRPL